MGKLTRYIIFTVAFNGILIASILWYAYVVYDTYPISRVDPEINAVEELLECELGETKKSTVKGLLTEIKKKSTINNNNLVAQLLDRIYSWPLLLIYLVGTAAYFRHELEKTVTKGWIKSISLFGQSIEFNEEVKIETELRIDEYRKRVKALYDTKIQKFKLNDTLRYIYDDLSEWYFEESNKSLRDLKVRATIHVPDILFEESLYQLLDYQPDQQGGAGRVKSVRFGIIGLTWRMEKSRIKGTIPTNAMELIEYWGMDQKEASGAGYHKHSFCSVILRESKDTKKRLGVFYMDADEKNVFGDLNNKKKEHSDLAKKVEKKVIELSKKYNLIKDLQLINESLSDKMLQIKIYDQK